MITHPKTTFKGFLLKLRDFMNLNTTALYWKVPPSREDSPSKANS